MIPPVKTEGDDVNHEIESLRWFVRLSEGHPEKVLGVALCALGAGLVGFLILRSPVLGMLGFATIAGTTSEYWLGTHYILDVNGATARCGPSVTSMEWSAVKRVIVKGSQIRLSPLPAESRMDAFRGVLLRTNPEVRENVLKTISERCKEDVRVLGS
jgi:hypothetical protein